MSGPVHAAERRPATDRSPDKRSGFLERRPEEARRGSLAVPGVEGVVGSSGQPLDPRTRAFMESRFGHDFGRVRVHTDRRAAESARAVNAHAYTLGHDIVFADGRFDTTTRSGRKLLAHELTHVVQQRPVLARQIGDDPAYRSSLERALARQPQLGPRTSRPPAIPPPPPIIEEPVPAVCPNAAEVRAGLQQNDIRGRTEAHMLTAISVAQAQSAAHTFRLTPAMLGTADRAIRQEFGTLLPAGRGITAPGEVTTQTPDAFAARRVPDDAAARTEIGDVAIGMSENRRPDVLRRLCVTTPDHPVLQSEVAAPILGSRQISWVRDYVKAHLGGITTFPTVRGVRRPHVEVPSESRNMGHIVVHEAMHYYVSPAYQAAAEANPNLQDALMEGGAEFLARHVIRARLASRPEFQINPGTYADYNSYVANHLMRGGVSTFAQAYFAGRIDLLGLTHPQPKLEVSVPGDPYEREADRMAEAVVDSPAPVGWRDGDRRSGRLSDPTAAGLRVSA